MKIIMDKVERSFGDIAKGECFMLSGQIWMKMEKIEVDRSYFNIVCLENGIVGSLPDDCLVAIVNALLKVS